MGISEHARRLRSLMSSLTHSWGGVMHIYVSKLAIIGSVNGLAPSRRKAISWSNAGILLIGPLGTNFNQIHIEIHNFSFKKIHLKKSSGKWRIFCSRPQYVKSTNELCLYGIIVCHSEERRLFQAGSVSKFFPHGHQGRVSLRHKVSWL